MGTTKLERKVTINAKPMSVEDKVLHLYNVRKHRIQWIADHFKCTPQNIYNHIRRAREAGKFVRPKVLRVNSKMSHIRKNPVWKDTGEVIPEALTPLQRIALGIMVRQPGSRLSFMDACAFYWQTIRSLFRRGLIGLLEDKGAVYFMPTDKGRYASNCSIPLEFVTKDA